MPGADEEVEWDRQSRQADKGREDVEAGWEGQIETDIGSTQAGGIDREDIEHRDGRVEEGEGGRVDRQRQRGRFRQLQRGGDGGSRRASYYCST